MGQVKNNEAKVWQYGHETWKMNFPFDTPASFFPMRATMAHIEQYLEQMEPEQNGWRLSNDFGLLHYF